MIYKYFNAKSSFFSRNILRLFVLLFINISFAAVSVNLFSQEDVFTPDRFIQHVNELASEKMQGRYPGTIGDILAVEYIAEQFNKAGLLSHGGSMLKSFTFNNGFEIGDNNSFSVNELSYQYGKDFITAPFSANADLSTNLVFVHYGFSVNNEYHNYDDYKNLDVNKKWVLILRGNPETENYDTGFGESAADIEKVYLAQDKGAGGVIFVSGEKYDEKDELYFQRNHSASVNIPVLLISRNIANDILKNYNTEISILENFTRDGQSKAFETNIHINACTDVNPRITETFNVVGFLYSDFMDAEFIVIGAHYDHLGFGGHGSNSRKPEYENVHPGADDNASGVSAMIELAFALSSVENRKNNYIFVAFGAEEKGLIGSRHFVKNLPIPKDKIKLMINLDMIGRLKADNSLQIGGVGTATEFDEIISSVLGDSDFNILLSREGAGPSDHASFYAAKIPVLFFSTGAHTDYHTPDDTADKLNYEGLTKISDMIYSLLLNMEKNSSILSFIEAGPLTRTTQRHGGRSVSLGLMPDFATSENNGLRVEIVTAGRPAALAGMKNGDIITAINGKSVKDIHEYMYRLNQLEKGDLINVDILRDTEKFVLLIQL